MSPDLTEEVRELIRHFADLPDEDRARILALVRSLCFCRTAELYSTSWAKQPRGTGMGARAAHPAPLAPTS